MLTLLPLLLMLTLMLVLIKIVKVEIWFDSNLKVIDGVFAPHTSLDLSWFVFGQNYCYIWGDLLRKVPLPVGGAKKRNIILLTIWCILRWYIVTFDKTKQLWAYPMSKTNLHHFLFMSVTLTFWVLRPFWALKSDLASVIALQLQHFVCQTFWYIKIRNPSTNKKVIPQNVKWYRFPKGLLC